MRYFAELAYNGARYYGWQRQPKQPSVQATLEAAFSTILGTPIDVTGCGRTDTGVHARRYFLHFDFAGDFPRAFPRRINRFLPPDIVLYRIFKTAPDAHARFDATSRSYEYHLSERKDPFHQDTAHFFPFAEKLDHGRLQAAASLLLEYEEFFPFCKTNTDVKTMRCDLRRSEWESRPEEHKIIYHVTADRFLRGMVRLIVGMCLNVGQGKMEIEEVRKVLEQQSRLPKSLSVPANGLFLTDIRYPFLA